MIQWLKGNLTNLIDISLPKLTKFQMIVHLGALVPFMLLVVDWFRDNLTYNPIQALELRTGKYALWLLLLTLACSPLNTIFGFRQVLKVRRTLGLYSFLYVSLHFAIFVGLDYQFDWILLEEAIFEKRYALIGFAAGIILLPLALTSTRGWMKRLGKTWKKLHKFVYLAGILVIIHYMWVMKADIRTPLLYGTILLILLIIRIPGVCRGVSRFKQRRQSMGFRRFLRSEREGKSAIYSRTPTQE
jgi:sulfoxide reductase heme-binding subunit YedZ